MITEQMHLLVIDELLNDPLEMGYTYYMNQYGKSDNDNYVHTLLRMLNEPYNKSITKKTVMLDFYSFMSSPPEDLLLQTGDLQIIWILLHRVPQNVIPSVVGAINELPAEELLFFLNNYGPEAMLYHFGNPDYTQEELILFERVARNVLEYLVSKDSLVQETHEIIQLGQKSRISQIFENVDNAPNVITYDELHEILHDHFGL